VSILIAVIPSGSSPTINLTQCEIQIAYLSLFTEQLKTIIETLYETSVAIHGYTPPQSSSALTTLLTTLPNQLAALQATSSSLPSQVGTAATAESIAAGGPASSTTAHALPREIISYVDEGRNPDIYTRQFVELTQQGNQLLKGRCEAWTSFRDVLAMEISGGIPELKVEVEGVIQRTGGMRA
jgi:Transcription factor subunit Med10 of Mediator complex